MSIRSSQLALVAAILSLSGCAMCANPFDCQYGAYGSRLPRADMTNGRVGSILDGASSGVVTTQPIIHDESIVGSDNFADGNLGQVDDAIDGEPQPAENGPTLDFQSLDLNDLSYEQLPAVEQIEQIYDTIKGEIDEED